MHFRCLAGVIVLMWPMCSLVFMVMDMGFAFMLMLMQVFVEVLMGVFMYMFVAMFLILMGMFVLVLMGMRVSV